MELTEIKYKLEEYIKRLNEIKATLKIETKEQELKVLEETFDNKKKVYLENRELLLSKIEKTKEEMKAFSKKAS